MAPGVHGHRDGPGIGAEDLLGEPVQLAELFSISVAAELAGLHPQTLRIYERQGLLDPVRSAGGTRRYSR